MARAREFSEDDVLEASMNAFWRRGYEATSITDLENATGIARGSIYKAFGDKRQLFLLSLNRYLSGTKKQFKKILDSDGDTIAALLNSFEAAQAADAASGSRGCFAMNRGIELACEDEDVGKLLHFHQSYLLRHMTDRIRRGQADGEVRTDVDPQTATLMLLIFHTGISASAWQAVDPAAISETTSKLLALLSP
tara:strand:+ start:2287 stop:2868 length:582 start_codon:yes stop_codon:yes gene_type:complete